MINRAGSDEKKKKGRRREREYQSGNIKCKWRANMGKDKKKRMSLFPLEACLWMSIISSVRQREVNVTVI